MVRIDTKKGEIITRTSSTFWGVYGHPNFFTVPSPQFMGVTVDISKTDISTHEFEKLRVCVRACCV